jgi:hypothetical protein
MRASEKKKEKLLAVAEPSSPFWIYTCRYKRAISISLGIILEKHARAFNEKLRLGLIMRVMTEDDDDTIFGGIVC